MRIKSLSKTALLFSFFFSVFACGVQSKQPCCAGCKKCSCFSVAPFSEKKIEKAQGESFEFKTFIDWKNACARLRTKYKVTHGKLPRLIKHATFQDTCLSKKELNKAIKKFIYMTKESSFLHPEHWISGKIPKNSFLAIDKKKQQCLFFVQKIIVDPQAILSIHADLHGDIHSFIKYLNYLFLENKIDKHFTITDKNFYLIFLGDYTDGWLYGSEVLYTLLRLKIANPNNVIMLRGNHEDVVQNSMHGFKKEFFKKFLYTKKKGQKKFYRLGVVYNLLPSAVYLGVPSDDKRFTNYLLFFHGGLEPRFNPHRLLAKKENCLYQWLHKYDTSWFVGFKDKLYGKTIPYTSCAKKIGFVWNDFIVDSDRKNIQKSHRRYPGLYKFSKEMTQKFLKSCSCDNKYKVRAIFRGHQHSHKPAYKKLFENHGIYNLDSNKQWDGISSMKLDEDSVVWTLQASPHALKRAYFKKWPCIFDIHVELKLDKKFKNWVLQPKKLECL